MPEQRPKQGLIMSTLCASLLVLPPRALRFESIPAWVEARGPHATTLALAEPLNTLARSPRSCVSLVARCDCRLEDPSPLPIEICRSASARGAELRARGGHASTPILRARSVRAVFTTVQ